MKKNRTVIFISLLLFAAQAGLYNFQPVSAAVPVLTQQQPFLANGQQLPKAEIEYGGVYEYMPFHNGQGWQKMPGCLASYERKAAHITAFYTLSTYTYTALFSNSNLSHNYPSHNFW